MHVWQRLQLQPPVTCDAARSGLVSTVFFEQRVGVCSASDATIKTTINTRHAYPAAAGHLSRANELNTDASVKLHDVYDSVPCVHLAKNLSGFLGASSHLQRRTSRVTRLVLRVTCCVSHVTLHNAPAASPAPEIPAARP